MPLGVEAIILSANFLHQSPVDTIGISRSRRMNIDKEEVNPSIKRGNGFVEKGAKCISAGLVSGRKNFDHRHDAIVADMPDDERSLLPK